MQELRVGIYTEVYRPIRNGVVVAVDALAAALAARAIDVTVTAPWFPNAAGDRAYVKRAVSIALPTRTGYRLVWPFAAFDPSRTIVHAHSPFVTGTMALRAARRARVPLVFTYHTRLSAYAHYAPVDRRVARAALDALTRAFANAADAVVVATETIRGELRRIGVRTRIEVIATDVDAERLRTAVRDAGVRRRLGADDRDELVLWAGRLGHEKNLPLALAAFARLARPHARLAIVGDGVLRERMVRRVRDLGMADRTVFAGEVEPEVMADLYAAADALLFTSTTETQGLVLSEARAAGLPIVAVDDPVTREVAGPRAFLAGAAPAEIAAALGDALDRTGGALRRSLGSARAGSLPDEAAPPRPAIDAMLDLYASLRR